MAASYRIISIGAMSAHPLWGEKSDVRAAHATITLVISGDAHILVDPSLPAQILLPRLAERAGKNADFITHVFLTSFHPIRRRGLDAFPNAIVLISEGERRGVREQLDEKLEQARKEKDGDLARLLHDEINTLNECEIAPDKLADGVDLFPLPGVTIGSAGLLLPAPSATILIAGDAVATSEHLEQGRVFSPCFDIEQARESLSEAIEIADVIVPGRDNLIVNPIRRF
ncbi:MAG: MBL fold metallo-hydrolase [Planctomycetes bacterium]|nr:MBL fold metallo-hydrolase [Planctomycetota bacterium]